MLYEARKLWDALRQSRTPFEAGDTGTLLGLNVAAIALGQTVWQ